MRRKHRNLRKAALLFVSLDARNAEAVLRQMPQAQIDALRRAVDRLGEIDAAEQNEVIEEFFRIGPLVPGKQPSGLDLDGRLPKHLALSSNRLDQDLAPDAHTAHGSAPFKFLQQASAQSLVPFLEREHPQTVAVVVSHLPSRRAAEILAALPSELQGEVARRLVDLDETDPDILREVERGLESWLGEQVRSDRRRDAGITALANILSAATPEAKQHILSNLARKDRQLAGRIEPPTQPARSFADFEHMDRASLTVILHHADLELLVLALAGATPELVRRVLEQFPPPEEQALREALLGLGPTRLSDIEEAQAALAELAGELEMRGEITPHRPGRLSVAV